jgi:hypothetical protein
MMYANGRSAEVEQPTHVPNVKGSNPASLARQYLKDFTYNDFANNINRYNFADFTYE